MKKLIGSLLSFCLIIGLATPLIFATGDYNKSVTMVGQWTNESRTKENTEKQFSAATDVLGDPKQNDGLIRSKAKSFLGWSTTEILDNKFPEDMKLYSKFDTISTVFPEGIPDDAKLYAVYYQINGEKPLPDNQLSMGLQIMNSGALLNKSINDKNQIVLNQDISKEDTLINTNQVPEDQAVRGACITDYATGKEDFVLNTDATFKMDKATAYLAYSRHSLFTKEYESKNAATDYEIQNPKYTYVDLTPDFTSTVDVDGEAKGFDMPDSLYIELKAHNWRPIYVLDDQGQILQIEKQDGTSLAGEADPFKAVTSNASESIKFKVLNPNKSKKLTIRTIIRTGDTRIPEETLAQQGNLFDTVTQDMKLIYEPKEGSQIKINKDVVNKMIESPSEEIHLPVKGSIKGYVYMFIADIAIPFLGGNLRDHTKAEINMKEAADLCLSYVKAKVSHVVVKYQDAEGNELHNDVVDEDEIIVGHNYDTTDRLVEEIVKNGVTYVLDRDKLPTEIGVVTEKPVTVVYVYKKKVEDPKPTQPKPTEPKSTGHYFPEPLPTKATEGKKDMVPNTGAHR